MAYLSKHDEMRALFERPKVRLIRDNQAEVPVYNPVTDIDKLIMREMGWIGGDTVYAFLLPTFEALCFSHHRAVDVIEFAQKRNTWTGELFT